MPLPWVIVGGTGYDVEEVLDPETKDMDCPSCERHVRFVERQLVKNLRVFGVPLVGVERGRRVFECPRCKTCVERGEDDPPRRERERERRSDRAEPVGGARAATEALETLIARAEDEIWLWRRRAETAERAGEHDLAKEAMELSARAERERDRLRGELGRGGRDRPRNAPAVVARKTANGSVVPDSDDEFAALKSRLARRAPDADADAPTDEGYRNESAPEPAANSSDPVDPPDTAPRAPEASAEDLEAEFEALKSRLRGGGPAAESRTDPAGYDALKRELSGAPPARVPSADPREVPPAASASSPAQPRGDGPGDDRPSDPLADLKRKLRKG